MLIVTDNPFKKKDKNACLLIIQFLICILNGYLLKIKITFTA